MREEHHVALLREQTFVDIERKCAGEQLSAPTASFAKKKAEPEQKAKELTKKPSTPTVVAESEDQSPDAVMVDTVAIHEEAATLEEAGSSEKSPRSSD